MDAFWILFSATISTIFFDHCLLYFISSYVMVMFFHLILFPHQLLFLKMWYVQSQSGNIMNSLYWSIVSWPQLYNYYSAKSFLNVLPPSYSPFALESYLSALYFCFQLSFVHVVKNIKKKKNSRTPVLKRNSLEDSINMFLQNRFSVI